MVSLVMHRVGSYWRQTYSPVTIQKSLYYQNEIGQSACSHQLVCVTKI